MNLSKIPGFNYDELRRQLPDFVLYLACREIDPAKANTALENHQKEIMMEMTEDERLATVKDWIARYKGEGEVSQQEICRQLNEMGSFRVPISPRKLRPIMEYLRYPAFEKNGQWWYRGLIATGSWTVLTSGEPPETRTAGSSPPESIASSHAAPVGASTPALPAAAAGAKPGDGIEVPNLF